MVSFFYWFLFIQSYELLQISALLGSNTQNHTFQRACNSDTKPNDFDPQHWEINCSDHLIADKPSTAIFQCV